MASSLIEVDPNGDLVLSVLKHDADSNEYQSLRVSSGAMSQSSPVFRAMLFGPWVERKPEDNSQWVVQLSDDTFFAMEWLIYAAHNKNASIAKDLNRFDQTDAIERMYHTIVAADKYAMIQLLKPFAHDLSSWLCDQDQIVRASPTTLSADHLLLLLHISWLTGHHSLLMACITSLIPLTCPPPTTTESSHQEAVIRCPLTGVEAKLSTESPRFGPANLVDPPGDLPVPRGPQSEAHAITHESITFGERPDVPDLAMFTFYELDKVHERLLQFQQETGLVDYEEVVSDEDMHGALKVSLELSLEICFRADDWEGMERRGAEYGLPGRVVTATVGTVSQGGQWAETGN
ncbi:hypothetical protein QBC41DRAFT_376629 [Cercophora samala]|uniref:BTB domain-containing protein n=1 Tax=Cercophora samala TaxID=330535 RepID=A0AA39Z3S0_9PEZI|nr:hypothetical protein QBC41DRAFT_376629 [Cercophora samala]